MSILKKFLKDTIIYGIAAVLPRAINILLVRLHTQTLAADNYAINTDYYVFAAYFSVVLTYGMETTFFRFFSKESKSSKVLSTAFISLLLSTIGFAILLFLLEDPLHSFLGLDLFVYRLLIATTLMDALAVMPFAYLRVSNKALKFTSFKLINILIYAFFNLLFLWYIPYAMENDMYVPSIFREWFTSYPKVFFIFIANLIASSFTLLLLVPYYLKINYRFDKKLLVKMLYYATPILIAGIAFVTNENLDKLLLGNLTSKTEMGIYAACYKLGVFMSLYIMAFRLGAEPFFFTHADKENAKETYAIIMKWFVVVGAFFMLFVVVFIDLFAGLLIGSKEYYAALEIVPWILLANLFLGMYHNLAIWYKLTDKTKYGMYFSIFGALVTVAANWFLIPIIGFMASAYATVAAYGFMMCLSYFFSRKHYRIPYETLRILVYTILSLAIALFSFYQCRGNMLFSIVSLIFYLGIILIFEKKQLKQLITK